MYKKYDALEKHQEEADKIELLSDGRILYYDKFRDSETLGNTAGSRFVTEYNPSTGSVKMWNEAYDNAGNVNRVNIKNIDGLQIKAPHFPATLKEKLTQKLNV